jgi:NitT/TauT family transport system ATP-binding protein
MLVILGPSGCGKTTLLNIIAGLCSPDAGERIGLQSSTFSYAFQEPRLLPWKTSLDNALFALSGSGLTSIESLRRVRRLLLQAGISSIEKALPSELSGGMKQRLSLVRAFAFPSDYILLDEAFQAVDMRTRLELMDVFIELKEKEEREAILVTHDVDEALYLADRIVVLSDRPAKIIEDFAITVPRANRWLGSDDLAPIERRLYGLLLGTPAAP